jgi:hypothetical protein
MKKKISTIILLLIALMGCDNKVSIDKSRVSTVEKLVSPDGLFIYYRYFVDSGMAFGSGTVRMNILKSTEVFDYSTDDYFVLQNAAPVVLGWENSRTLKMIAITDQGEITTNEPFKRETKQWNGIDIKIDYYHMFSTGRSPFTYTSCSINGDTITFTNGKESYSFVKGKFEISYNGVTLSIQEIDIKSDPSGRYGQKDRVIVSSNNWELTSTDVCDIRDFVSNGILIEEKL